MDKKINKNVIALFVGIFLVIVIFIITYVRFSLSNQEKETAGSKLQNEITSAMQNATKISAEQLNKKINAKEALNIVDVREQSDYVQEHLPGSTNIPLSGLKDSIGILDKNKPYIVVDSSPSLATTAYTVKAFSDAGFKSIIYLDGGFSAWKENYNRTISAGNPNSFSDQSKVNYITSDKLKDMLASGKGVTLIDVRKNADYAEGHIKNAVNIFLEDLESKKDSIPVSSNVVAYGGNDMEAFQAAVRLFDMGIFNAYALSDGFITWKSKNYEIVK